MTNNIYTELEHLKKFRHHLHKFPEQSGKELETAKFISKNLSELNPDIIHIFKNNSIACVFNNNLKTRAICIRADIDAVLVREENNNIDYKSSINSTSHACGHDGHSAILYGLAREIAHNLINYGKVVLLFQSSEETGNGAQGVIHEGFLENFDIEKIYSLHNLPGFPLNSIVIKKNIFASASVGIIIKIYGKTSHASEPEKGNNPSQALAELITFFNNILENNDFDDYALSTIIHAKIGTESFGISPGDAVLMATLRAYHNEDLEKMQNLIMDYIDEIAELYKLRIITDFTEEFPSTVNDNDCIDNIIIKAQQLELKTIELQEPFKWSEDFGYYAKKYKTAMFGLGAGTDCAPLHSSSYDFPDSLLTSGINMFSCLIKIK